MRRRFSLFALLAVIGQGGGCGKQDADSTEARPVALPPRAAEVLKIRQPVLVDGYEVRVGRRSTCGTHLWENDLGKIGLEITLTLSGPGFADVKGVRIILEEATEESGGQMKRYLFGREVSSDEILFRKLTNSLDTGSIAGKKADDYEERLWFLAPFGCKNIRRLSGRIEVVVPSKDSRSIVTANYGKDTGKPLKNEQLTAAGVEITLQKLGDKPDGSIGVIVDGVRSPTYDISHKIKDPAKKVFLVEAFDSSGKELELNGTCMGTGGALGEYRMESLNVGFKPPADTRVKFYLLTEKNIVTLPFEFNDIRLGQ